VLKAYNLMLPPGAMRESCLADAAAAVVQGFESMGRDFILERRSWDFPLQSPNARVLLWHGTKDADVHHQTASFLDGLLRRNGTETQLQLIDGENHTLLRRRWGKILNELIAACATDNDDAELLMM
jgi:pimeloyl-ACP methyl ester carboxylesterase